MEPVHITTNHPGYEGWCGVLNGVVHKTNLSGTIVSVSIAPPPGFDEPLREVYLPISFVKEIKS